MFCVKCGKELNESAKECPFCGEPVFKTKIKNYLLESILATIFCNIIFGAIAFYYSLKVKNFIKKEKIKEAIKTSKRTNRWLVISAIAFFIELFLLIYLLSYSSV